MRSYHVYQVSKRSRWVARSYDNDPIKGIPSYLVEVVSESPGEALAKLIEEHEFLDEQRTDVCRHCQQAITYIAAADRWSHDDTEMEQCELMAGPQRPMCSD